MCVRPYSIGIAGTSHIVRHCSSYASEIVDFRVRVRLIDDNVYVSEMWFAHELRGLFIRENVISYM